MGRTFYTLKSGTQLISIIIMIQNKLAHHTIHASAESRQPRPVQPRGVRSGRSYGDEVANNGNKELIEVNVSVAILVCDAV